MKKITTAVASLFIHLEMNFIADIYDVYQSREHAVERIRTIMTRAWPRVYAWYPAFLEATFKKSTDRKLHSLLVDVSLSHFGELDGSIFGSGVDLDVPAFFYSDLLGKAARVGMA